MYIFLLKSRLQSPQGAERHGHIPHGATPKASEARCPKYKDDYKYKLASGFMMAQPYGFKRIMSSYDFYDTDQGPPGSPPNSYNSGSCGNGWICEHRWAPIMNMAKV